MLGIAGDVSEPVKLPDDRETEAGDVSEPVEPFDNLRTRFTIFSQPETEAGDVSEPVEPFDNREQDEPDNTPRYDYAAMAKAKRHWAEWEKRQQQTREAETEAGNVSKPAEVIQLSDDSEPEEPHNASRQSIDLDSMKQKLKMNLMKTQKATEAGNNRDRSAQSHQSKGRVYCSMYNFKYFQYICQNYLSRLQIMELHFFWELNQFTNFSFNPTYIQVVNL